jgi:hypothetical protein
VYLKIVDCLHVIYCVFFFLVHSFDFPVLVTPGYSNEKKKEKQNGGRTQVQLLYIGRIQDGATTGVSACY